jgi:hypothetical protein
MTTKILRDDEQALFDSGGSALFDATALPAAGASRLSEIVGIEPSKQGRRSIGLSLRYVGQTGAAGAYPEVRVWVSCKDNKPDDSTDTSWRLAGVTDGVITAAQTFGAVSGATNGRATIQADMMELKPGVAAAGVIAVLIPLTLGMGRWLYVEAAEKGDTTHPGKLTVGLVHA